MSKKVQRDFEKPSFEEKTRFHPHILDMSGTLLLRTYRKNAVRTLQNLNITTIHDAR